MLVVAHIAWHMAPTLGMVVEFKPFTQSKDESVSIGKELATQYSHCPTK